MLTRRTGDFKLRLLLVVVALVCGSHHVGRVLQAGEPTTRATAEQLQFFEARVRPLLVEHCYSCHSARAKKLQAGLSVDSRQGLIKGGDSGEAIVPGDPDSSLLIEAVRYESYEMPPKGKLPAKDVEVLAEWIRMGAPWPEEEAPVDQLDRPEFDLEARRREHWVWQPLRDPARPEVRNGDWARRGLDDFVLAELEDAGLSPADDVDRSGLLRRLHMDLVGLPPTPEQVAAFEADDSPAALEYVVDELLDSPRFGERWGRHWLDLVRYAESRGHEFDNDTPNAFQYRDYIIRALNADVPYDQFVREQIAGDLIPNPRLHPTKGWNESLLGTGFWYLGEWVHSPVDIRKDEADRFDNMIDVMSKTFLGVTVSCARCHDHKFDAISTADYYSLSGFLQSSDYRQVRFESIEANRRVAAQLDDLDRRYGDRVRELLDEEGLRPPSDPTVVRNDAIVVDYGSSLPDESIQDGFVFGTGPRRAGDVHLRSDGSGVEIVTAGAATYDPFWDGLKSITEGLVQNQSSLAKLPKSGRTLRTPTFELKEGNLACRVQGRGHVVACVDSHRLVAGPLHGQTIVPIEPDTDWTTLNLERYVGHRIHLEFVPAERSQLSVRLVVQGLDDAARNRLDRLIARSDAGFDRFAEDAKSFLASNASANSLVEDWKRERDELRTHVVLESRVAPAMLDGSGEDDHVLVRGSASNPGEVEPRHFLTAVTGDEPMAIASGSGRLELAAAINDPANPLASRVVVNRIWHHLMGRGLVASTDDFGVLGQRPTHPELLDHLATRFLADGRSIKGMIKSLVLSRTYRMSTNADPAAVAVDPTNRLWHHRPPKRLEGEAIRDSLLALSGRLDTTMYGPPVPIHLTPFMDGRGRPANSGPLDGDGRRSIYVAVRRNFLSPFMLTFDTPVPFSTMGRRNVSNVPAQALILMNDPFVVDRARGWAERALANGDNAESRVRWLYFSAFARQPTEAELSIALGFVGDRTDLDRWADLAHGLINTKEFVFLR